MYNMWLAVPNDFNMRSADTKTSSALLAFWIYNEYNGSTWVSCGDSQQLPFA